MKARWKNFRFEGACSRPAKHKIGRRLPLLSFLPLLLLSIASPPVTAGECEAYGVAENHAPMGTMVHIEPLYRDELNARCAGVSLANAASGSEISGCSIPHENGVVESYYWVGDHCAMQHELCHAQHGTQHTERYLRELKAGVPMPYCPSNQLKLTFKN